MAVLPAVGRWFGEAGTDVHERLLDDAALLSPRAATILTGQFAHNHGILNNDGTGRNAVRRRDHGRTLSAGCRLSNRDLREVLQLLEGGRRSVLLRPVGDHLPVARSNGYRDGAVERPGPAPGRSTGTRRITSPLWEPGSSGARTARRRTVVPGAGNVCAASAGRTGAAYEDAPVGPFRPTLAMTERDRSDKPPFLQLEHAALAGVGVARSRQLRTLMSVDDLVRSSPSRFGAPDETRDTLAFFLSDNGFLWGEHGAVEGLLRTDPVSSPVPVRWPGHIREGSVDGRTGSDDGCHADHPRRGRHRARPGGAPRRPVPARARWSRRGCFSNSGRGADRHPSPGPRFGPIDTSTRSTTTTPASRVPRVLRPRPRPLAARQPAPRRGSRNDPDVGPLHDLLTADRSCVGTACP